MVNRTIAFLLFLLFGSCFIKAQGTFEFQSTTLKNDTFQNAIIDLDDGGFATKNIIYNKKNATYRIVITRFNFCKQVVWSRYIDAKAGPGDLQWFLCPYFTSFIKAENGGYLVLYTHNSPLQDVIASRLDSNGLILWSKKIHSGLPEGYSLALTSTNVNNNGYAILGISQVIHHYPTGEITKYADTSIYLVRLDKDGKLKWSKNYKNQDFFKPDQACITKLLSLSDNGFVMHVKGYYGLLRTDSLGNIIWVKSIEENYSLYPLSDITRDKNDRIYLYRQNWDGIILAVPFLSLIAINPNGDIVWAKKYYDSSVGHIGYEAFNVTVLKSNKIILSNAIEAGVRNEAAVPIILELDSNGSFLSSKFIQGIYIGYESYFYRQTDNSSSFLYKPDGIACATNDSGYMLTGFSKSGSYLNIFKSGKDLSDACNVKDGSFYEKTGNPHSFISYFDTLKGYSVSDTTILSHPFKNKFSIICSGSFIPMANLGNDTVLCSGKSYTLYKGINNNGARTLWSTGDTTSSITVTKTGHYWLQLTHGFCSSTDTVSIIFKGQLKPGLSKKVSICSYDSVLLQSKDTAVAKYYWETPKKAVIDGNSIMAKDSGYYFLKLTDALNCSIVDTVHVGYYPLPKAIAGPDTVLCRDQVYTMQGAGGITYQWIPSKYLSSATDPHARASLVNTQQYILVVSNQQGCRDTSKVLLKVKPALSVKILVSNTSLCQGQSVVLKAIAHGGDSLHYYFSWPYEQQNGAQLSIAPNKSVWHKIVLSDNCTPNAVMDSIYIKVIPATKADFTFVPGNPVKTDQSVHFQNKSQNASVYFWNFGFNNTNSKEISPVFQYTDSGNYKIQLVAYGFNGCTNDTAYGYIHLIDGRIAIYIPNAFSPDGNGLNDLFEVRGAGIGTYSYNIYNRWGENIFHASNPQTLWDGNFKNTPAPEGVYLYQVDVTDIDGQHHYLKGTIHLIRD